MALANPPATHALPSYLQADHLGRQVRDGRACRVADRHLVGFRLGLRDGVCQCAGRVGHGCFLSKT